MLAHAHRLGVFSGAMMLYEQQYKKIQRLLMSQKKKEPSHSQTGTFHFKCKRYTFKAFVREFISLKHTFKFNPVINGKVMA